MEPSMNGPLVYGQCTRMQCPAQTGLSVSADALRCKIPLVLRTDRVNRYTDHLTPNFSGKTKKLNRARTFFLATANFTPPLSGGSVKSTHMIPSVGQQ